LRQPLSQHDFRAMRKARDKALFSSNKGSKAIPQVAHSLQSADSLVVRH
jgi:hypothetical protein